MQAMGLGEFQGRAAPTPIPGALVNLQKMWVILWLLLPGGAQIQWVEPGYLFVFCLE